MIPSSLVVPAAVAALAFLAWVLLRLVRLTRRGDLVRARRLAAACVGLWALGLLVVTLGGRPHDPSGRVFFNWIPFATQTAASTSEIAVNFLLFMPVGFLLPWIAPYATWQRIPVFAAAGATVISTVIEVLQAFTSLGTAGDLTDILLNTAGCTAAATISSIVFQKTALEQPARMSRTDVLPSSRRMRG
ncbi:MAG TPA: VanZ family protein [Kribbella sp.]|nr:VanZ family protein [Kribbella sp.]